MKSVFKPLLFLTSLFFVLGACNKPQSYNNEVVTSSSSHTHIRGEATLEPGIDATCTEDGYYYKSYYCLTCKEKIEEQKIVIPALGHTEATREEDRTESTCETQGHYYTVVYCTRCGQVLSREKSDLDLLEHNYVKVDETPASFEQTGLISYRCVNCGAGKNEVIPRLEHTRSEEWYIDEERGTHYHACLDEGYLDIRLDEASHFFGNVFDITDPITGELIKFGRKCRYCGYQVEEYYTPPEITLDNHVKYVLYYHNYFRYEAQITKDCVDVIIEASVRGLPVDKLSVENGDNLVSIVVPGSIETINEQTFANSRSLETVVLEEGVEKLDFEAFNNCESLRSISLPNTLKTIGNGCFKDCSKLYSITIPSSVERIGDEETFLNCFRLKEIINKSTSLNVQVRSEEYGCLALYAIKAINRNSESEIEIKNDCVTLSYENEKYLIDYIGDEAVLVLPSGITQLASFCFYKSKVAKLTVSSGVKKIGDGAFQNSYISFLSVPETIEYFGYNQITRLCELINKSSLSLEIQSDYQYKIVENENDFTCLIDNGFVSFLDNDNRVLVSCFLEEEEITIPDYIATIGLYCFFKNSTMKTINIPSSVKLIDEGALSWNVLENVNLAEGVRKINDYAFHLDSLLTTITLPSSIQEIGIQAFDHCDGLKTVVVHTDSHDLNIARGAFRNCPNLEAVFKVGDFQIQAEAGNDPFLSNVIYYSENEPVDSDHRYFHYVDGVPILWP